MIFKKYILLLSTIILGACGAQDAAQISANTICAQEKIASFDDPFTNCITKENRQIILQEYKRRINDGSINLPNGGFDPRFYPPEVIASVYALGLEFNDPTLIKWSENEIKSLSDFINKNNGYFVWPIIIEGAPTFGELSQSRLIFSLGLIYKHNKSQEIKKTIMQAYDALNRLPMAMVKSSITKKQYELPYYGYHDVANPRPISSRTLDPNHDAGLSATYTLMYKYVLDKEEDIVFARQKSIDYFRAALDLTATGKCLPLADDPVYVNECDTRYNGYWLALMLYASKHGSINEQRSDLEYQFNLIDVWSSKFLTSRSYPKAYVGPYPDVVEPMLLNTAAAQFYDKQKWDAYVEKINALIAQSGESIKSWPAGWLYPQYFH